MDSAASQARSRRVTGARVLVVTVSTVTGACSAALAGLSISAVVTPVRRLHPLSIVIALFSAGTALLAFRAAMAGYTDRITAVSALVRGMFGSFIGLFVVASFLFLFRPDAQGTLAHALGRPASSFTIFPLLMASVLLGFGAGFVARIRIARK